LEWVEIDSKTNNVISYTDHFTDMINSVVTVPESPQSLSFNPTQIKNIKAMIDGAYPMFVTFYSLNVQERKINK
jgi:hypothetical protein